MSIEKYLIPCSSANICFDCQKAVGGCSWSEIDPETERPRFQPPEGCTAEPTHLYSQKGFKVSWIPTYKITDCPLFVPDEKREVLSGEATEDQLRIMLERWRKEDL